MTTSSPTADLKPLDRCEFCGSHRLYTPDCDHCHGTGQLDDDILGSERCWSCNGTGLANYEECADCEEWELQP